jgi:hypothetical protein
MLLAACCGGASSPSVASPGWGGTISTATAIAAGHHRSGNRRHAARHGDEELAPTHRPEIGTHEQRCLDHADKHVRRRAQPNCAAESHRALERAREEPDEPGQHAPVKEQRRECAHHQHDGQRAERQDERRRRGLHFERRRTATEVAEYERGAGLGCLGECGGRPVEQEKDLTEERNLEEQCAQHER